MNDEELAQRLFLFHIAVMRHEYTDWPDGGDDRELMLGESNMPEDREPRDIGWWIVFGVWLLFGVLLIAVVKKVVAS